ESYSTAEEIDARNEAAGRPKQLGYDNFDRDLSDEQKAAYRAEGREPALRLRVPDIDLGFTDLVRGEITFPAGSTTDFVVVRPNGAPLYTLVNPVDDALMGVTHVLRGEDLLSSTPRQIALYLALIDVGITTFIPQFGHLPYVMGEGNKKLSKRDPESNLFHHRDRGFVPEGLVNYLALLGWGFSADRDVFSRDEFAKVFDVANVNPNPARFDLKKAEAINSDHIRQLSPEEFAARIVPYLAQAGFIDGEPTPAQSAIIASAAPLIQPRTNLLGEAPGMLGFLFTPTDELVIEDDARATLSTNAAEVLSAARDALERIPGERWLASEIEEALRDALIDGLSLKPRDAFGTVRVATSGRRVSPPLFESLELLGPVDSLARIDALAASLG
ncbi:MAG: glutamate--tRNA ligase, partial [Agromyces sp.]